VRRVVVTGFVVAFALSGCFGGGEKAAPESQQTTTSDASTVARVSPPTPTERVLQAIRKCEVERIFFTAGDVTFVTYRGGTKARSKKLDQEALSNAAQPYVLREDNCRVILAIE
jgi:hypothetical protein